MNTREKEASIHDQLLQDIPKSETRSLLFTTIRENRSHYPTQIELHRVKEQATIDCTNLVKIFKQVKEALPYAMLGSVKGHNQGKSILIKLDQKGRQHKATLILLQLIEAFDFVKSRKLNSKEIDELRIAFTQHIEDTLTYVSDESKKDSAHCLTQTNLGSRAPQEENREICETQDALRVATAPLFSTSTAITKMLSRKYQTPAGLDDKSSSKRHKSISLDQLLTEKWDGSFLKNESGPEKNKPFISNPYSSYYTKSKSSTHLLCQIKAAKSAYDATFTPDDTHPGRGKLGIIDAKTRWPVPLTHFRTNFLCFLKKLEEANRWFAGFHQAFSSELTSLSYIDSKAILLLFAIPAKLTTLEHSQDQRFANAEKLMLHFISCIINYDGYFIFSFDDPYKIAEIANDVIKNWSNQTHFSNNDFEQAENTKNNDSILGDDSLTAGEPLDAISFDTEEFAKNALKDWNAPTQFSNDDVPETPNSSTPERIKR